MTARTGIGSFTGSHGLRGMLANGYALKRIIAVAS
jgi:hypothetical protein